LQKYSECIGTTKHSPQSTATETAPQLGGPKQSNPVTQSQREIDLRPFRSKADRERELPLHTHYHSLAIPEVVAALQPVAAGEPRSNAPTG